MNKLGGLRIALSLQDLKDYVRFKTESGQWSEEEAKSWINTVYTGLSGEIKCPS